MEAFLASAGFDKGPWVAVTFAMGIAAWFGLNHAWQWMLLLISALAMGLGAMTLWAGKVERTALRMAIMTAALAFAVGMGTVWLKSSLVGTEPIARPVSTTLVGRVLERIDQPSRDRIRLVLATRMPKELEEGLDAIKVRVNVPYSDARPEFSEGAVLRLKARLMPPMPPMLPGGYDFARTAWFNGLSATGSVQGDITVLEDAETTDVLASLQRRISQHVRDRLGGSPGSIAAALASGDRGAIAETDEAAMRDAGLTHLLSISGLHVSAVIAAAYLIAIRLLALWPWLALRIRLPILAAAFAALAGISYTLLTGAQVPTIRSCVGAVLVLLALAVGREPLSLRMVAFAAGLILLLWPEALVGPSFQMSFAAVIAIVALHTSQTVRSFLAPREESPVAWSARRGMMLLVTGFVIEIALMPIVLYHFHRAGLYGAFANVIAIPLTTFISMPLIALALLLDVVGLGAPIWWLAGKSLELLLVLAHFTANQPGSVKLLPHMTGWTFALFILGGLWIGLWKGRVRLAGCVPIALAMILLMQTSVPDVLVSGDGRHVGITGEGQRLLVLRDTKSSFTRDNLLELAGMDGEPLPLAQWPDARCSRDFCTLKLQRGGREWHLLMARSQSQIAERALAAACDRADIVIADRYLPRSCQPIWLKADRRLLDSTGGLSLNLATQTIASVADNQGEHGWWKTRGRQ